MASIIEKLITPSFYSQKASGMMASAGNYYKPMFRSGRPKSAWGGRSRPWRLSLLKDEIFLIG
eukprot:6307228-Ditylum_brightwellii.AAC.1